MTNWFQRLLGQGEHPPGNAEDNLVLPAAGARTSHDDSGLPSFRPPNGRVLRGANPSAQDVRALVRDAFTPSQPVSRREMFAGRRDLLQQLIMAIEDQRLHFILYGDRGIGKTSILRLLTLLAEDAGYLVSYVSCGERLTFSDLARRVARRIPLLNHRDYAPGSPEIEKGLHLADILPEGDIDVSLFGEALSKISDTSLVIMLDEFDRVQTADFRASVAELIKNLSDSGAPAQIMIAGVASDLSELIAQIPSIRRNVVGVLVPNMSESEAYEMLDRAEAKAGLSYPPDARELIHLASLGLPYLIGLVAQHAGFVTTARNELVVTKADVHSAIRAARTDIAGRIAAATLVAINFATQQGDLLELSQIAHAALRNGGLLPAELVTDAVRGKSYARGGTQQLIEAVANDPLNRWRFKDDGAAIYIWLSALIRQ